MDVERPFDYLNSRKGKNIILKIKDDSNLIQGKLVTFDINVNLVVEIKGKSRFIRGDQVIFVE